MTDNAGISTLTGILLDVSDSMKNSASGAFPNEKVPWIRSVFQVIDDLITHDVSDSNLVFAVGVGAREGSGIFDVIRTLDELHKNKNAQHANNYECFSTLMVIENILGILQENGAKSVRKWAPTYVINDVISRDEAILILERLESDENFVNEFVNNFLPSACKGLPPAVSNSLLGGLFGTIESGVAALRPASKHEIEDVVRKAKHYLSSQLQSVGPRIIEDITDSSSVVKVKDASRIIHGYTDETELTESRTKEILSGVEPFIFGGTPLISAIGETTSIFDSYRFRNYTKLLFVLSDGMPTDNENTDIEQLFASLQRSNVYVVSCFITNSKKIEQKRLFDTLQGEWDNGAKFLFKLSSKVPTQLLPRAILIKRKWKMDINNNETRLFLQVNRPEHIKEACDLARNVVCCQDALAELLVSVSLDIYINQDTTGFRAEKQERETCYANASAAVLHLAMKRILGRKCGYPDFKELRKEIVSLFGEDGANTNNVLKRVCPKYRLQYKPVWLRCALHAVTAKRPVIAKFALTDREWTIFNEFFILNKTGVLSSEEIDTKRRSPSEKLTRHAVVLVSFNSEYLRFMNSWGEEWGDQGFFRIKNADVFNITFVDVFWTSKDLYQEEKEYYKKHGSEVAEKVMKNLKGLSFSTYQCPLCKVESLVAEFSGCLSKARCPKCLKEFECDEEGNILALNVYLTSLSK